MKGVQIYSFASFRNFIGGDKADIGFDRVLPKERGEEGEA